MTDRRRSAICRCAECPKLDKLEIMVDGVGAQAFRQPAGWYSFPCFDGGQSVTMLFFCSDACVEVAMDAIADKRMVATTAEGGAKN